MAQVELTVLQAVRSSNGVNVTDNLVTGDTGDTYIFRNNGRVLLYLDGDTAGTATISTPNNVDSLAIADLTAAVTAGDIRIVGPFPQDVYNNENGYAQVTVSAALLLAAIRA